MDFEEELRKKRQTQSIVCSAVLFSIICFNAIDEGVSVCRSYPRAIVRTTAIVTPLAETGTKFLSVICHYIGR